MDTIHQEEKMLEIVKNVLSAQEARVNAYAGFESAFRLYSTSGSEAAYVSHTKDVTSRFQEASTKINDSIKDLDTVRFLELK